MERGEEEEERHEEEWQDVPEKLGVGKVRSAEWVLRRGAIGCFRVELMRVSVEMLKGE